MHNAKKKCTKFIYKCNYVSVRGLVLQCNFFLFQHFSIKCSCVTASGCDAPFIKDQKCKSQGSRWMVGAILCCADYGYGYVPEHSQIMMMLMIQMITKKVCRFWLAQRNT